MLSFLATSSFPPLTISDSEPLESFLAIIDPTSPFSNKVSLASLPSYLNIVSDATDPKSCLTPFYIMLDSSLSFLVTKPCTSLSNPAKPPGPLVMMLDSTLSSLPKNEPRDS